MPTETITNDSDAGQEITHPGLEWLDHMACAELDEKALQHQAEVRAEAVAAGEPVEAGEPVGALGLFFVDAGHVISEETLNVCRGCPVRRECIIHAYLGGPGGTPIVGGYMGGFSLGQRKSMTLEQALERAENDPPRPIKRKAASN